MKKNFCIIVLFFSMICRMASAQNYQSVPDQVSSGWGYTEKNGSWSGCLCSETLTAWPMSQGSPLEFVQYIYLPAGQAKAILPVQTGGAMTKSWMAEKAMC